jgi:integrase
VTIADVEDVCARVLDEGYPWRKAAHVLKRLSFVYRWAIRAGHLRCTNPCLGAQLPPRAEWERSGRFSADELSKLLAYTEQRAPMAHAMSATCIYAGLRKGEAFALRWCDVRFEDGRIDVLHCYRRPSERSRQVRLHPKLAEILRSWQRRCGAAALDLVFPLRTGGRLRMGQRNDLLDLPEILAAAGCHVPDKPWGVLRLSLPADAVAPTGAAEPQGGWDERSSTPAPVSVS